MRAVALLESRTGRSDAPGARKLAEVLGNLPLALDHAAAYCKRTQMRFADYAEKASSLISKVQRAAITTLPTGCSLTWHANGYRTRQGGCSISRTVTGL